MSNLKNNFTSKLTSVVKTSSKKGFVYTASFEDGTQAVIRTSNREYVSVTQISCNNHFALDPASGKYAPVNRTDFLFSSKPTAALGKNEQDRVMACVQVTSPAPKPVEANSKTVVLPTGETFTFETQEEADSGRVILAQNDEWFAQYSETRDSYIARYKDGGTFFAATVATAEPTDKELAAYQPKIVTDAITNALAEQHRLEHSGDGDCDRHPLG